MIEQDKEYERLYNEIREKQEQLANYIKSKSGKKVKDYVFKAPDGKEESLSKLFGNKKELIVVHNMGKSCPYCNLWAQGFSGLYSHLSNRASFVVISPDKPEIQKEVIKERGYTFPMYSGHGNTFISDMGFYEEENENYMPGFSVFQKTDSGEIIQTAKDYFGPFDPYNPVWHMFALLPTGVNDWSPKIKY
jgi:predicted dithiol-disulfide oxidoreductase (DUF899 family)